LPIPGLEPKAKGERIKVVISRNEINNILTTYRQRAQAVSEKDGSREEVRTVRGNQRDRLEISPKAREVQRLKRLLEQIPEVRQDKVQAIRQKISRGEYGVSAEDVAEKILGRALADKLE